MPADDDDKTTITDDVPTSPDLRPLMKAMHPFVAWLRQPWDFIQGTRQDKKLAVIDGPPADPTPFTAPPVVAKQLADRLEELLTNVVLVAESEIGKGELPGKNNCGPDIARYCAPLGDGHEWCAGFQGYCIFEAAKKLGMKPPIRRSLTAKTLADYIAEHGRRFEDPNEAWPGDWLVFDRGITGSHKGHIEVLRFRDPTGMRMPTITGNSMPLVCERKRNIYDKKLRFREFVSLRKAPLRSVGVS